MQEVSQNHELNSAQPEISEPPKRRMRPRGTVVSQFNDIDDDFEPIPISAPKLARTGSFQSKKSTQPSQQNSVRDKSSPVHYPADLTKRAVSFLDSPDQDDSGGEMDSHASPTKNPRKRPPPSDDDDDDDDDGVDEAMLPAAAAMKRRKIEEEKEARRRGLSTEVALDKLDKDADMPAKKHKVKKEVNIQDAVRERRQAADDAARRNELALYEANDGLNVEELSNLAIIEEMEIKERTDRPPRILLNGEASERWDERWNGRKNFKRFRRRGDANPYRRGQSVMIPLEEVKKKDYGVGEEYWLESSKTKKRKEKENSGQSQSQSLTTAKGKRGEATSQLMVSEESQVIDVRAPRTTRQMDKANAPESSTTQLSTLNGKRAASSASRGAIAAKRQKVFTMSDSDSDSDDEPKFQFTSRG